MALSLWPCAIGMKYQVHTLQLLYYKLSRSTSGPGPPRAENVTHPTKLGVPCKFCLLSFCQNARLRLQRLPGRPGPGGWEVLGQPPPRTFLLSRTTYVPYFIQIRPAVRISIQNTHIALYVLHLIAVISIRY